MRWATLGLVALVCCGSSPTEEDHWVRIPKAEVCATPQTETRVVPYPNAQGVGSFAMAPNPESDCMGAIRVFSPFREGTWGLGNFQYNRWDPVLVFNTEKDAIACLGSSSDFEVRVWKRGMWRR